MSKVFHLDGNFTLNLSIFLACAFLCSLPFDRFFSNIVLISWFMHILIHRRRELLAAVSNKYVWLVQSIFWITVISTIHTDNIQRAFSFWERQLPIFLLPLIIFADHEVISRCRHKLFLVFGFLCTIIIGYLYSDAIRTIIYYNLPVGDLFSHRFMNHNFSLPLDIHASYLSMMVVVGLLGLVNAISLHRSLMLRVLFCLMIASLIAGLIQLGSRAVVMAFLLVLNIAIPFYYFKSKRLIAFSASLLITAGLVIMFFNVDSFHERFISDLESDLVSKTGISNELVDSRRERWDVALQLVKTEPFFGYGTGMETELLKQSYFDNKLYHSFLHRLNAHNQYISFLLKGGVIALFVYLATISMGLYYALKAKDLLFTGFIILLIIVSLGENILDVNKGIVFYSFFFSLFMLNHSKRNLKVQMEGQPVKPLLRLYKMTSSQPIEH